MEVIQKRLKENKALNIFREYIFFRGLKYADLIIAAAAPALFRWLFAMPVSYDIKLNQKELSEK